MLFDEGTPLARQDISVHNEQVPHLPLLKLCQLAIVAFVFLVATAETPPSPNESSVDEPVSLHVAAVLPLTGRYSQLGQAQARVLDAYVRRLDTIYNIPVELSIHDDGSDATQTISLIDELDSAHAVICCNHESVARDVLRAQSDAGIVVMTLAPFEDIGQLGLLPAWTFPYWFFTVVPDERVLLRAMLLDMSDRGVQTIGFMGLAGDFGEAAVTAFERMLAPGSMRVIVTERYPPDIRILTPEALWVATRQPSVVMVWGLAVDTRVALDALERRGFERAVYVNPNVYTQSGLAITSFEGVRTVLDNVTAENWRRPAALQLRLTTGERKATSAHTWDAMMVLEEAFRSALAGGNPAEVNDFRQRVREGLISMPPVAAATATFDYTEDDHVGIIPRSLVIVEVQDGVLTPLTLPASSQ
ncbi:MAG: ABC transporter substrate-binding protein [Deinococcota bacterium]